jgi:hypothetical protein
MLCFILYLLVHYVDWNIECKKMNGTNVKKILNIWFVGTINNRDGNWLLWHFLTSGVTIKF